MLLHPPLCSPHVRAAHGSVQDIAGFAAFSHAGDNCFNDLGAEETGKQLKVRGRLILL